MTSRVSKTAVRVAPEPSPRAESGQARRDEVGVAPNRGQSPWLTDAIVARHRGAAANGNPVMGAIDAALAELRLTPLSQLPKEALETFFKNMPKIDLHRHLNGSIPLERLLKVAKGLELQLPANDVDGLRPYVQITAADRPTLPDYLAKFDVIGKVLKLPRVIEELAKCTVEDAARDNLVHVEIRFCPQFMAAAHGLDMEEVVKAVCRGVRKGVDATGTTARLIIIIARQQGVDEAKVVAKLVEKYRDFGVVAADLASASEVEFPPALYAEVFDELHLAGICATVHAGESGGADSIKSALLDLKAQRAGHGTRILEDPKVAALARDMRTIIEACLTANVQVGAIASLGDHPILALLRMGVLVALCTDNPSISGVTLSSEFQRLTESFGGITLGDVEKLIQNSADGVFLTPRERIHLRKRVAKELASAEAQLARDAGLVGAAR